MQKCLARVNMQLFGKTYICMLNEKEKMYRLIISLSDEKTLIKVIGKLLYLDLRVYSNTIVITLQAYNYIQSYVYLVDDNTLDTCCSTGPTHPLSIQLTVLGRSLVFTVCMNVRPGPGSLCRRTVS